MSITTGQNVCVICHQPITGEWARVGKDWCFECNQTKVRPKQKVREKQQYNATDRINEHYAEMRSAIAERDKYRAERDSIKAAFRVEVKSEVMGEIRRLSVWERIKLCFDPFL